MKKLITYLSLHLLCASICVAQQEAVKGVPYLKNFTPSDYNHKGKVWAIDSAPNGIIYMAADKAMLEFDGEVWSDYKGSQGIIRSILVKNDSLIYTGSDLDFGVWERNKYNEFEYTSLYPFKEDLNEINEEFWNVHHLNDNILFVSASNIYIYKDENLTKISAPGSISKSFVVGDRFLFVDEEGLFELSDLSPQKLTTTAERSPNDITGVYENNEGLVLVSRNSGLWQYTSGSISPVGNELSDELKKGSVFSFEKIDSIRLAFGTISQGLYISDIQGNLIHHINKNKGLQNNTVLSLHHQPNGKLWLSMDYGVSFLDLGNEYTFFYDYEGNFGTGYTAEVTGDTFYLGTNQGLYTTNWQSLNNTGDLGQFSLIKGTEGQVWSLQTIDDQILMSHDQGLFSVEGNNARKIGEQKGIWTLQPFGDVLLAGTYNGISVYEKTGNEWSFREKMELILGSCNRVIKGKGQTIWVNIPNYGVIKATLNENLYPIEREIFLSEEFKGEEHVLRKSGDNIVVLTETHRYDYNSIQNDFSEQRLDGETEEIDDLLLGNTNPEQLNEQYEFYPVYNGFAFKKLDNNGNEDSLNFQLIFREAVAYNNENKMRAYPGAELPHRFNNIRIRGIVPNVDGAYYQYREQDTGQWSSWIKESDFDLVGLSYDEHTFTARARVNGIISQPNSLNFSIASPWYLSWYAYSFYVLATILMMYGLYRWQEVSLGKQKKDMLINQRKSLQQQQEKHKKTLKLAEQQKSRAEFEQLKAQLKSKTIELATKAKENDEKNRILQKLKSKFEQIGNNPESVKVRSSEILRIIDSHIEPEDNTFEIQIDELHQEFFDTLRDEFPDLTRYDLRLCAYIKIGFNSKEISNMLNIKPSSVYISRSRLRKKLNIETDEDLHSYLNSI
ncbi:helix-turn-helix and ligand-binding sensor domain-containing protein [Gracilimonas sp. BCB1]|uniref:helix-turn-helix and ligand-binding sensor domain-containing protein n=1 Tax=Gracilimonas sp. BCB1 TaxID=3152362 RepID=UPI0032D8D948